MRQFSEEEKKQIDIMYKNGEKIDGIRSFLHCNENLLRSYLKNNGYKRRPRNVIIGKEKLKASRKHSLIEDYFHNIDTPDKAYWLGFLYADGNVQKRQVKGKDKGGQLELTLMEQDKYHIQNFLYCIGSDVEIKHRDVKLNGKTFGAERACISSIEMVNDLISHGCVPAKSLIIKRPNISENLFSHFIRGYFDGDGCVAFYPEYKSYRYTIQGTRDLLNYIVESAELTHYDIRTTKSKCFELLIYSKGECEKFHNYIYANRHYFLERKYNKSLAMMKWCKLKNDMNETQSLFDSLSSELYYDDSPFDELQIFQIMPLENQSNDSLLLCSNE